MKQPMRRLAFCLLSASALLSGCSPEKPEALIRSAKGYLEKNDGQAALIQLKSALLKDGNSAEGRFLLGRTLLDEGDAVAAEVELRKALALAYPDATVLPVLARAMLRQGKHQKIIESYSSTVFAAPIAAADLKTSVAAAYTRQGSREQAAAALDLALSAVPGYGPALLERAKLKADQREFTAAFALIDQTLAKTPNSYEALELKGDLLLFAKADTTGALDAYRQALQVKRDLVSAHASIVSIHMSRHDIPAAKAQFAEMKKVLPSHPQTILVQGQFALLDGDFKTAKEISQQLMRVAPDNVQVLTLAGIGELRSGSALQAQKLLFQAMQLAPSLPGPRRLLAQTYLRLGQPAKVLETLAPLLEGSGTDAGTLSLAGQASLQSGDIKSAEAQFAQAVKLNPADTASRTALAIAQFSKGNVDRGFSELQQIAPSTTSTLPDLALVSAYLRQRNFGAALKAVDELERKQPDKLGAANLRGMVQLMSKDLAAARQSFERVLVIDPANAQAAVSLAAIDLTEKKPEQAKIRLDKLLSVDRANVQVLLTVARLQAAAGASNDEVVGLLVNAVKLNPTAVAPRLSLIDFQLRNKNIKAAISAAQDGVDAVPDSPQLIQALAKVHLAAGQPNQGISALNKLVALQPKSPQPLLDLADTYLAQKDTAAARGYLKRALRITPDYLPAQRRLIVLEIAAGQRQEALAVARTVQSQRPKEAAGYWLAGDIETAAKNWDAAIAAFRAGLRVSSDSDLAVNLHVILSSAKKPAEAEKFTAEWVKDHPQDGRFLNYLGDVALTQHNYAAAEEKYLAVIQLQPEHAAALNNLAFATSQLKKQGALGYAERANALQPNLPAFMDTLAVILADEGQIAKALVLEQRAVDLEPLNYPIRLNLAKLYIKAGETGLAKTELDRLAKLGKKFSAQAEVSQLVSTLYRP